MKNEVDNETFKRGYAAGYRGDCYANHSIEVSKMNKVKRKAFDEGFLKGQLDRVKGK